MVCDTCLRHTRLDFQSYFGRTVGVRMQPHTGTEPGPLPGLVDPD